ncbi:tryptophan-rich sensory protein [Kineococcus sp. SYSU DK004]|uniref:tryptophan-rich sensory protein n=1 Tax=Kineococcus sp. SYSU DK004 TaxID=3383125 RepID=UPI003D7F0F85
MTTVPAPTARTGDAHPRDVARQAVVAVSALVAVVGAVVGSGALGGTPIAEAGGGALSATATLVAAAGPAFSIWSVVYTGLVALAVWQLLPGRRQDARQRRTGWWVAASLLLNAAWILTVQAGQVSASVAVIVALLAVLVVAFGRLVRSRPASRTEAVVLDGTIGLYLGWVSIATVANAAAALEQAGLTTAEPAWAVGVLAVAALVGVVVARLGGGRLAYGAGLTWGLAWVAVGRASGESASTTAAVTAAVAAVVVAAATVAERLRSRSLSRAPRR